MISEICIIRMLGNNDNVPVHVAVAVDVKWM